MFATLTRKVCTAICCGNVVAEEHGVRGSGTRCAWQRNTVYVADEHGVRSSGTRWADLGPDEGHHVAALHLH
eukprot:670948-Rhodomonas_salina.1